MGGQQVDDAAPRQVPALQQHGARAEAEQPFSGARHARPESTPCTVGELSVG